ncbi:MAG TPA: tetratricopeptide repeat protein [Streptosporangiaceae bacterium]|nr:tetratricopeptide repeat protein [Streptosporangiaceae bacterium]
MADSNSSPAAPGPLEATSSGPVRSGLLPPLADRFSTRPETAPDLLLALERSASVALIPRQADDSEPADWVNVTGKTQLAAYFAESQWRGRALDLLIWIDASSQAAVLSGYVEAASKLTGARPPGSAASIATRLLRWLRRTDRRWLVVFDDLPDRDVVHGLWPSGPSGKVLITAANRQAVAGMNHVLALEIGPFSRREAMSYLVGRLSSDPDQRRGAIGLIEDLRCEPVALMQATAVIVNSWITCDEYRERFARRVPQLARPGHPLQAAGAVTWTLAIDRAAHTLPGGAAQLALAVASVLDGQAIPGTVFATKAVTGYALAGNAAAPGRSTPAERAGEALASLEQVGLISIDQSASPPVVRISHVLQREVRSAMSTEMLERAILAAADALVELWPAGEPGWLTCSLRAGAHYLHQIGGGLLWAEGCHPVLLRAGQSLDEEQLTGPAVDYWASLSATADRVLGPSHPDSQVLVERLARAYMADGRPAEAVAWYQRIMAEWDRDFGPDHPRTLTARVTLGRALVIAGLATEAVTVLTAVLADYERTMGAGNLQSLGVRDELAAAYLASGQLDEAIRLYRRSLADRERLAGPQDPNTIAVRQKLAEAYLAAGHVKEAISHFKKSVADRQRALGADHPDTLGARAALASAHQLSGRMATAVQLHEQVRADSLRVLGPEDPQTLAAAVSLAGAYYSVGRISDASSLYEEVIERGEQSLPHGHPLVQSARESLSAITGE